MLNLMNIRLACKLATGSHWMQPSLSSRGDFYGIRLFSRVFLATNQPVTISTADTMNPIKIVNPLLIESLCKK